MESYDWQRRRHQLSGHTYEFVPPRAQDVHAVDRDHDRVRLSQRRRAEPPNGFTSSQQNVRHTSTRSSYDSQRRSASGDHSRYSAGYPTARARGQRADSWVPVSPAKDSKVAHHADRLRRPQDTRHYRDHGEAEAPPVEARRSQLITPHSEYDIIKPLESRPGVAAIGGMNAGVFLLEHRETRELYVEKRLRMRDDTDRARVKSENFTLYEIRKAGSCKHIVDVIEAFAPPVSPPYCSLVLEYCNSGTLKDFIDRYIEDRKITPEPFAWHIFAGVTSALCACHYGLMDAMESFDGPRHWQPICHLDVKPSNMFLTSIGRTNAYPRVVLGDFGCAA